MPLFKRSTSQPLIPPVESTNEGNGGSGQSASSLRDRYNRRNGVGDVYTRPGTDSRQLDDDRNELFSGYNPAKSGSGRFLDGPDIDEEDDVEAIKQKTRFMKQESVNSTQRSVRLAREAVEVGGNTLRRLGEQSGTQERRSNEVDLTVHTCLEKLANTERHLDVAKGHSARADDKTEELRKLNRSIFIPAITFDKDAKHAAREAKVRRRYEEERAERDKTLIDIRDTQDRLGKAQAYGSGRMGSWAPQKAAESVQRIRREADSSSTSDDEMENEVERNLDEIQELVRNLRSVGTAMGAELDRQNERISGMDDKTVKLDGRLHNNTMQLYRAGGM
ncbi:protein transporter SEC9 [Mycena galericulata]|nr:protein transporter SEC9 [Mycena galericulata]